MRYHIGRGKRVEVPIKAKFRERKSPTFFDKSSGRGSVRGKAKDHPKGWSFALNYNAIFDTKVSWCIFCTTRPILVRFVVVVHFPQ